MYIGLAIYDDLSTVSGGYLYDRMLMRHCAQHGDRVEVVSLPRRPYWRSVLDNFSGRLYERFVSAAWDILIQDELNHPSFFLLNEHIRARVSYPVVALVHHLRSRERAGNWDSKIITSIERRYLQSVDGCIFNNAETKRAVQALGISTPSVLAYPGRRETSFSAAATALYERVRKRDPFVISFVGNIIPRKGLLTLIDALLRIKDVPWQLNVVGDMTAHRAYTSAVLDRVTLNGIIDRVTFWNQTADPDLSRLLASSHIFAMPSFYEGLGIAYMEALSHALPVIASKSGGAGEIITDGVEGYLVEPGDVDGIAGYVRRLAADPDLLFSLSMNAIRRFHALPSWEESGDRVRRYLAEDILKKPLTQAAPEFSVVNG